jgi:hypothetical protein
MREATGFWNGLVNCIANTALRNIQQFCTEYHNVKFTDAPFLSKYVSMSCSSPSIDCVIVEVALMSL